MINCVINRASLGFGVWCFAYSSGSEVHISQHWNIVMGVMTYILFLPLYMSKFINSEGLHDPFHGF